MDRSDGVGFVGEMPIPGFVFEDGIVMAGNNLTNILLESSIDMTARSIYRRHLAIKVRNDVTYLGVARTLAGDKESGEDRK